MDLSPKYPWVILVTPLTLLRLLLSLLPRGTDTSMISITFTTALLVRSKYITGASFDVNGGLV